MKTLFSVFKNQISSQLFRDYQEEIRQSNLINMKAGSFIGFLISFILLILSILPFKFLSMTHGYLTSSLFFSMIYLISKFVLNHKSSLILPFYYFFIIAFLFIAILMGTIWGRNANATTFIMMLILFSLFIIDKPLRLSIVLGIMSVIFCIAVYFTKNHELHNMDICNCLVFYFISLFISRQMIWARMNDICVKNQLKQQRDVDILTKLYNRGVLERTVSEYVKEQNEDALLVIMDIDNFKSVNDILGHGVGDELLKKIGEILKHTFRPSNLVCRLGGDEFVIFLPRMKTPDIIQPRMENLVETISSISLGKSDIKIGASIGISAFPENGLSFNELYERADSALYRVKNNGKNGFQFYNSTMLPKIIVVDDCETSRVILEYALNNKFTVLQAADGVKALQLLEENPDTKLIITDIQMPNMDGITLIKKIKENSAMPDIAIIACTQHETPESVKDLFDIGIDDFISKPVSVKVIQIRVENVLKARNRIKY